MKIFLRKLSANVLLCFALGIVLASIYGQFTQNKFLSSWSNGERVDMALNTAVTFVLTIFSIWLWPKNGAVKHDKV